MSDKIIFALPSLAHGGAQKVFIELVSYLSLQGLDVYLLCLDKEGDLIDRIPEHVNAIYLSSTPIDRPAFFKRISQWFKFRKWVENNNVTAVYSTITGMNLFVLSCFFFNKKLSIVIREASSLENIHSKIKLILMRLLYRRANKIICTSKYVKSQLLSIVKEEKNLLMIPNPIDLNRILQLSKVKLEDMPSNFEGHTLISVGRLIPAKGFDILINAFGQLNNRSTCRLFIIGEGPERPKLEALIKSLALEGQVLLLGYCVNPYPIMSLADVYILSSRWEGYVNTVIEAMALNMTIVATDCNSEPGAILRDELGGALVAIEDSSALARAIEHALLSENKIDYKNVLSRHELSLAGEKYRECCFDE